MIGIRENRLRLYGALAGGLLLLHLGCAKDSPAETQAAESEAAEQSTPEEVSAPEKEEKAGPSEEVPPATVEEAVDQTIPSHPGAGPYPNTLKEKMEAELKRMGPGYKPRTKHLFPDGKPEFTNRLVFERSPYLRQHAHNPVNWRPWGDEAFETALAESKPVLLSVGYATCHWCHVMEEESFEDLEIATYLNENYICIKVDREERPDVDGVYMSAVHMMRRRGGWPMTVWLTPSREPYMAGTYFPPRDGARGRSKGFLTLIRELREEFVTDPTGVANKASQIAYRLQRASSSGAAGNLPDEGAMHNIVKSYQGMFDTEFGGFGTGNKFPRSSNLDFLMRYIRRTGSDDARAMVVKTLDAMKDGGLYDHVDYGFHRYTTERRFRIPHFEKMLYDNAQLVVTYLEAFQLFGDREYERVARETLDYIIRDMTSPEGGFYSATDADSEGEEGVFAIWRPEDVIAAAGLKNGKILNAYFNVRPGGNFEHGTTVLYTTRDAEALATELGMAKADVELALKDGLKKMFEVRRGREQPLKDDKILTGWNGLMISAFARGGLVLNEERYTATARAAAQFVLKNLKRDGRLLRRYHSGESRFGGVLDDYAYLIAGLLDLYEADPNPRWIAEAKALQSVVDRFFADPNGAYFMTPSDGEKLLVRERPDYDGARPSSNSVTALNLLRLNALTTDDEYRAKADLALGRFSQPLSRGTTGLPKMASALDFRLDRSMEVVIVAPADGDSEALLNVVRNTFLPNRVLVRMKDGDGEGSLVSAVPIVSGKRTQGGKATAYVCEMGACLKPTTSPKEFAKQLAEMMRPL